MKKYETEFKLEVVQSFLAGEGGAKLLARRWSVPEEKVRTWVSHYRLHGIDGLRPKRSAYSAQFKLQVLVHQDREQLSSRQVAALYDIHNPNQVVVWRRNLDQGAPAGARERERRIAQDEAKTTFCRTVEHGRCRCGENPARRERPTARGGRVPKKIACLDPVEDVSCADKAHLISGLRQHHKLADLLRVARLARSTFYYHQRQLNSRTASQNDLQAKIRTVYDQQKDRYGYRRITAALRKSTGKPINHKCVQWLMQLMGLRALIRVKKQPQRFAGLIDTQLPNVLARDFSASAPDQKWATDITEFNVAGQKLNLSACMDLYNGEIIAHRMARRPVFKLVSDTLQAALSQSKSLSSLTVHSDQGWHYKMKPYRAMLARRGVTQSMSRKGNCFDNAVIESFFGTPKAEYLHLAMLGSIDVLEAGGHDYIRYYNHERIKLGLQGLSPVEYRLRNTECSAVS